MLTRISPIDGRYASKTQELSNFFSEYALIKYRVWVELQYFVALIKLPLPQLEAFPEEKLADLERLANQFDEAEAEKIKQIERTTNHDVKAVEYYIKDQMDQLGLSAFKEFVHFGLTSQDINNTSFPLMLKHASQEVYIPHLNNIIAGLEALAISWEDVPMLARTHGQPASPTRLGKEIDVFVERLKVQLVQLKAVSIKGKFGGATGGMNAHYVTYPSIDWHQFAQNFLQDYLQLERSFPTTQIEHYDNLGALFHAMMRIHTILIDLCRDIWTYVSMDYFKQKVVAGEVGSSAMPHKVNPIDFENAEGNLGIANAVLGHLAEKLPISRLQRDLTDSTVLRNIGVPFGHAVIAFQAILKGLNKLVLNEAKIASDLENNWMVVSEAIQNILRREAFDQPYEALKALTRGKAVVSATDIHNFIDGLEVSDAIKAELKQITPQNYLGK
ncbi:MAG: adenylosuccinate lyase [Saprospiraceae bacterium]|nr:adenylosuccinate lyase [Saprospiraceae bacterium]